MSFRFGGDEHPTGRVNEIMVDLEAENDRHGAILNDVDAEREAQGDSFSKSINETVNGSHRFEIKGYSLAKGMGIGKYISSDTFTVGGFDWAIYFYPDGKNQEDNSQHVSIFIALASEGTDVRALFELTLLDQSGKGKHKVHSHFDRGLESGPYTLKYRGSMWGYKRYLKRVNLESSDYIKDDCLVMLCTVGVVRTRIEGPKQYVLPVPPSDIGESLHELLESEIGCDVEFEVGGETFRAHKLVLASRSTVFRSDFFGVSGDSNSADKVVLEGIQPYIFKAMLGFIYSDKLPETAAAPSGSCTGAGAGNSEGAMTSFIQKVLAVADRFNVERLKLLCEAKLSEQLNVGTAATTLALADHHGCLNLKDSCLKFSASHLTGVMRTQGFRHLEESCPSLLSELLGAIGGSVEEPMSRKRSGSSSIFGVDTAGDGGGGAAESVEPNSRRLRRRL